MEERDLITGKKCFLNRDETEERDVMRVSGGSMSSVNDGEDDGGAESSCFSSSSCMKTDGW